MKRLLTFLLLLFTVASGGGTLSAAPEMKTNDYEHLKTKIQQQNEADSVKYFKMVEEFREEAERKGLNDDVHLSYVCLSGYLTNQGHVEHAKEILQQFRQHCEDEGVIAPDFYDAWQTIVLYYYNTSQMMDAITVLKQMQEYATKQNDNYGLASVYITYGTFYNYSYNEAMKNLNKALEYTRRTGNSFDLYYVYYVMAVAANRSAKYKEVLDFTEKMISCAPNHPYVQQLYNYLRLEAFVFLGERKKAKECYDALNKAWKNYDVYGTIQSGVVMGMVKYLCNFGQPSLAKELLPFITIEIEKLSAEVDYYEALGKHEKALDSQKKLTEQWMSRLDELQQAEMMNANAAYNNQQLEIEKARLEIDNAHGRSILFGVVAFALLLVSAGVAYIAIVTRRYNKQLKIERDNVEEERKKAVFLSEMKTAFINNMSHEVRTPLNSILGFNDLLNNPEFEFSKEEREEMLAGIHVQTESLMDLLSNVIFLSRMDGHDIQPEQDTLTLSEIWAPAYEEATDNQKPRVPIEAASLQKSDITLHTDRTLLTTAFTSVLDNAIKFTHKGRICVEVSEESVLFSGIPCPSIRIVVTDTGEGIPEDKAELIFERFEKLGRMETGFGLGLSIARESLALIGGTVRLDTSYKEGARFVIELPKGTA